MKPAIAHLSALCLLTFCAVQLFAQGDTYMGTSAANFLKIGLGAKAVGMGESYVTASEDASSMFWNPGTISRIGRSSVTFSTMEWLVGTSMSYLSATVPFSIGTVGLDVAFFSSGDIDETTLQEQDGTGRVVSASDLALGLGYGVDLTDRFSVGVKVKYIREQLAAVNGGTFAVDVGTLFTTSFLNDLKIGIVLSNFGGDLTMEGRDLLVTHVVPGSPTSKQVPAVLETNSWPLPLLLRIGVATDVVRAEDITATVGYTVTDGRDHGARHNIGAAATIMKLFTVRGGYRFNYDEVTFSAGAGVAVTAGTFGRIGFDYAYTDFGRLKGIHQFSLGLMFD